MQSRPRQVPVVSGKRLIPAIAVQSDGHMLSGHLREVPRRDRSGIGKWLPKMPDQFRQHLKSIGLDDKLMMFRTVKLGYPPGIGSLVKIIFGEANGKSFYGRGNVPRHHGHDSARIDASTQKTAQRNIAEQSDSCCLIQQFINPLLSLVEGDVEFWRIRKLPVFCQFESPLLKNQVVGGWKFFDPVKYRGGAGNVGISQEIINRCFVQLFGNVR